MLRESITTDVMHDVQWQMAQEQQRETQTARAECHRASMPEAGPVRLAQGVDRSKFLSERIRSPEPAPVFARASAPIPTAAPAPALAPASMPVPAPVDPTKVYAPIAVESEKESELVPEPAEPVSEPLDWESPDLYRDRFFAEESGTPAQDDKSVTPERSLPPSTRSFPANAPSVPFRPAPEAKEEEDQLQDEPEAVFTQNAHEWLRVQSEQSSRLPETERLLHSGQSLPEGEPRVWFEKLQ